MKIRKQFDSVQKEGKVLNIQSDSQSDTYSCDYINGMNTYSTEETFTGKYWIDGKKIYSIVHNVTENLASGSVNNKNISSLNIENIVKIDCVIATNTGINGSLAQGFQSYVLNDKSILRSYNGTGVNVTYFRTTIEYTKTTD